MKTSEQGAAVQVRALKKHYDVHEKEPGFIGSLRAFVNRKTKQVDAVKGVLSTSRRAKS